MMNANTLIACRFVCEARDYLARASACLSRADDAKRHSPGAVPYCVRAARENIRKARQAWAAAMALIATGDALIAHHYRDRGFGWQAEVCMAGERYAWLWRGECRYAQRQSAQRAALRERGAMVKRVEDSAKKEDIFSELITSALAGI